MQKQRRITVKNTWESNVLLFLAIILSGSAISVSSRNVNALGIICIAIASFLYLYRCRWKLRVAFHMRYFPIIAFFIMAALSFVINRSSDALGSVIRLFVTLLMALLVSSYPYKNGLINAYINLMRFIAYVSLVCYFLFVIVGIPSGFLPTVYQNNSGGYAYKTIAIYSLQSGSTRNYGPFWEPSIYGTYLALTIYILLFHVKGRRVRNDLILFLVTLLTTSSSGGISLTIIILAMYYLKKSERNAARKLVILFGAILFPFFYDWIAEVLINLNSDIFGKIFAVTENKSSYSRLLCLEANMITWMNHPIWGAGLTGAELEFLRNRLLVARAAIIPMQSSTTGLVLAGTGVGGIMYHISWLLGVRRQGQHDFLQKILLLILIVLMINVTSHLYNVLTYMFMFVLLTDNKKTTN